MALLIKDYCCNTVFQISDELKNPPKTKPKTHLKTHFSSMKYSAAAIQKYKSYV